MAKFMIECPHCGRYTEASTSLFAKRKINCSCGYVIDTKKDRLTSRDCLHCGNNVVYNQAKGDKAVCPVCHEKINTPEMASALVKFTCPSCSCELTADKHSAEYTCPLCETVIDVQERVKKESIKNTGIASVIKYEGGNDVFVWKHPIEDFNLGSQLIVHESQEAVFFRDGRALDLFGAGRYTLETGRLPVMNKLYNIPTGSGEFFHSEVYFINMTTQMDIKWGTDSKVRLFDPASGLHIEIGAYGSFNLKVVNSRKLLLKLVGTVSRLSQDDILGGYSNKNAVGKFKSLIITNVKTGLANTIKENKLNILEIDGCLDILSKGLMEKINLTLEDYGLTMPEFYVTGVSTPDDDPNFKRLKAQFAERTLKIRQEEILKAEAEAAYGRKMVQAQTDADLLKVKAQAEAEAYKMQAYAEAEEMRAKGYSYQQETARQVGLEAMKHGLTGEGGSAAGAVGGAFGDLAGAGIALGTMGSIIGLTKDAMNPVGSGAMEIGRNAAEKAVSPAKTDSWDCECGNKGITGKFCSECGKKRPERDSWDCECGNKGITGRFCSECGRKRPEKDTWDCECGNKDITGKFCSECGRKRPEKDSWDCKCGNKGITGKFCPECGCERGGSNE